MPERCSLVLTLCLLVSAAWADQVLAPGSTSGPLTADGFAVHFESPYDVANVFLVVDPTIDTASNATFSTEVMLTFEGDNVWEVPYVVNKASGMRNWTLSSCNLEYPFMAGTWGLELVPINFPGGTTYEIGYLFGTGNETLDAHGQEAEMYTEKAIYEYGFEATYTGVADLQLELWGDQFSADYITGIYIGKNDCPTPDTAVVSYTNLADWDGQPITVTIPGASHGNFFVVIDADNLVMSTTGPWPSYSVSMTYTIETLTTPTDDGDVSSGDVSSGADASSGNEDDGGDGDGIQTWEIVLIIGAGMIAMLVCGGLALFGYMKYKAWQFDRQWDEPVYDSY